MEPIALIPELTKSLTKVGRGLAPWAGLVRLEELLLRRARSAFLVHWFGTGVPVKRLNLYIVIANIADLRERFRRVQDAKPGPLTRMNLLGPTAGLAGVLVGLFLSPVSGAIIGHELSKLLADLSGQNWLYWLTLVPSVVVAWLGQLTGLGLIAFVGAPLALVAAIAGANQLTTRAVVELTGHLAMLIDAALGLWEQINGPRGAVRNPLLRAVLDFLDGFANLFAQILGAVSLIVVRVLPLVPNLMAQFEALSTLIGDLLDALKEAVSGIGAALSAPFGKGGGLGAILNSVFEALIGIPDKLVEHLGDYLSDSGTQLGFLFDGVSAKIAEYLGKVRDAVVDAFRKTPFGHLVDLIDGLIKILPGIAAAIKAALNTPGPPEPPDDGEDIRDTLRGTKAGWVFETPDAVADLIDRAEELPLPKLPDFSLPPLPTVPSLPDKPAIEAEIGRAGPVDYAKEARRLFKEAREKTDLVVQPDELLKRPASVFGPEMRALRAQGKLKLTDKDTRLRDALFFAVGRLLPGNLRIYAPELRSYFDMIDEKIYARKPAKGQPLPQQELDEDGALQPRVNTLRIRATGAQAPDLRAFRDRLVQRLQLQGYHAPAGVGAGG